MMRVASSVMLMLCGVSSVLAQDAPAPERIKAGGVVFHRWCVECHGEGEHPGTSALQRKYQGAIPAALEKRTTAELPESLIRLAVRNGMSFMPFFRKTEVTDPELDALVAYLQANTQSPQ